MIGNLICLPQFVFGLIEDKRLVYRYLEVLSSPPGEEMSLVRGLAALGFEPELMERRPVTVCRGLDNATGAIDASSLDRREEWFRALGPSRRR